MAALRLASQLTVFDMQAAEYFIHVSLLRSMHVLLHTYVTTCYPTPTNKRSKCWLMSMSSMSAERLVPKTLPIVDFPIMFVYLILLLTITSSLDLQVQYKAPALYSYLCSRKGDWRDADCGRTQNLAGVGRTAKTSGRRTLEEPRPHPHHFLIADIPDAFLIRASYPNGIW